jgi:hypothetical protein
MHPDNVYDCRAALGGIQVPLIGCNRYLGRVWSHFASPGDDYLVRIGELAYAVSSLEWTVLDDLTALAPHLPARATTPNLVRRTTGQIAKRLSDAVPGVADVGVSDFLRVCSEALRRAAELRNAVLHARPAMIDGQHRLHGWRTTPPEAFVITDEWFAEAIAEIAGLSRWVHDARSWFTVGG